MSKKADVQNVEIWTPEWHRLAAEAMIRKTYPIYKELQAVPREGINYSSPTAPNGVIHLTQRERRDDLGKSLQGLYALAQVHATLAHKPAKLTVFSTGFLIAFAVVVILVGAADHLWGWKL